MKVKRINESALNEETLEQAIIKEVAPVAKAIKADVENWDGPYGEVEAALDRALKNARRAEKYGETSDSNVLLVGRAGTGKTERIKNWAKQRGIHIYAKDAQSTDATDLGGIIARDESDIEHGSNRYATRLGNHEFDPLDQPNSVLFIDEINRASKETLGSLLTLIQNHTVVDPVAPGGRRLLKGMLFTIAAMNPYNPAYEGTHDLDMAMRTRFRKVNVEAKNEFQAKFFENYFKNKIEAAKAAHDVDEVQILTGQLGIAKTLMASPEFRFDDDIEEFEAMNTQVNSLNPRTLTTCIKACDGTKEDFLELFPEYCNPAKLEMVEDILSEYYDVDDEANAALAWGDDDPFAKKQKSLWDSIASDF